MASAGFTKTKGGASCTETTVSTETNRTETAAFAGTNMASPNAAPSSRPRNTTLCRHFLNGYCNRGETCRFVHDVSRVDPRQICRHFAKGNCRFGRNCRFIHLKPELPYQSQVAAPEWRRQGENRGPSELTESRPLESGQNNAGPSSSDDGTGAVGGEDTDGGAAASASPGHLGTTGGLPHQLAPEETSSCRQQGRKQRKTNQKKTKKQENGASATPASNDHNDHKCSICMEDVVQSATPSGDSSVGRFGLLSQCTHCFCMPCILQWEKTQVDSGMRRTCPVCRTMYHFITPSESWVELPQERARLVKIYGKILGHQHCRYFQRGQGVCPSDTLCPYLHLLPDGTSIRGNIRQTDRSAEEPGRREEAVPPYLDSLPMSMRRMLMDRCPVAALN